MNEQITGALFKRMVLHGAAVITAHKQAINDLNVFPVPDGDTGTNMSLTIRHRRHGAGKSSPATVEQAASVTASACCSGAPGATPASFCPCCSVAFPKVSRAWRPPTPPPLPPPCRRVSAAAYSAVMKPAEGTVLTVSRLAAQRALDAAAQEKDVEKVLEEAIQAGHEALAETIEMNPVLKKAGVVDAGGKGYLMILEGMLAQLRGEPMPGGGGGGARKEARRTSPPSATRTSPSPSTPCSSSARPPTSPWTACVPI